MRSSPRELREVRNVQWPDGALPLTGTTTLFLRGECTDAAVYARIDEMPRFVADAEVVTLQGQGHLAQSFAPHDLAPAVLDFLDRH